MRRLHVLLVTLALALAGCIGDDEASDDAGDDAAAGNGTANATDDGGAGDAGSAPAGGNETTPDAGNETGEGTSTDEPPAPDPSAALLDQSFDGAGDAAFTVPTDYARLRVGVEDADATRTAFTVTLTSPSGENVTVEGGAAGVAPGADAACHWANVEPGDAGEWTLAIEPENPTESLRVLVYATDTIAEPTGETEGACEIPTGDEG